jgi:TonB family protein
MRTSLAIILLSSFLAPAAVHAATTDATPSGTAIHISTGVIGPAVINSSRFSVTPDALAGVNEDKPSVVLALRVNEKGLPENVRIVHAVSPRIDEQVLDAVRDFRFTPATLDKQAVPVDLHLTVVVQR